MRRETIIGTGVTVLAVLLGLAATKSSSPQWSWQRGEAVWIVAGAVAVGWLIMLARPPHLGLTDRTVRLDVIHFPVSSVFGRTTEEGPYLSETLALKVTARGHLGLKNCEARILEYSEPPSPWRKTVGLPAQGPPAPLRLHWVPSMRTDVDIRREASDAFEVLYLDFGTNPTVRSPDIGLPYYVHPGTWAATIQVTAEGYSALAVGVSFVVTDDNKVESFVINRGVPLSLFRRLMVKLRLKQRPQ